MTGDAAPDGNGEFGTTFSSMQVNDQGRVSFSAALAETSGNADDDRGSFYWDGSTLSKILREGDPGPDGASTITFVRSVVLNDTGHVAVLADLLPAGGSFAQDSLLFGLLGSELTEVVRQGDAAPEGDAFRSLGSPSLNIAGHLAFRGILNVPTGSFFFEDGLYVWDQVALVEVARYGEVASDGTWGGFGTPRLDDAGALGFIGSLDDTPGGFSDMTGVFKLVGTELAEVARAGDPAPGGGSPFVTFSDLFLNDEGQAAFRANFADFMGPPNEGVFIGDGTSLREIAGTGDASPDGRFFSTFRAELSLNDHGMVLFTAELADGGVETYLWNGTEVSEIPGDGGPAPDGNGSLTGLSAAEINDAGQIVFNGLISGTSGGEADDEGIFMSGPDIGLVQVAREGDSLFGSAVVRARLATGVAPFKRSINAESQVVFFFELADGRRGLALWSPLPQVPVGLPRSALWTLSAALIFLLAVASRGRRGPRHECTRPRSTSARRSGVGRWGSHQAMRGFARWRRHGLRFRATGVPLPR